MNNPLLLLILDGWGRAADGPGNAVCTAHTPALDALVDGYPSTELACSGRAVGLPDGFMGNSEVGHMNIGAGRIVYQDMTRIDISIEDGTFYTNPAFLEAIDKAKKTGGRLHMMGLVSDGGVHSHQNHIYALLETAKRQGLAEVFVHCFLDGRDTPPDSGLGYVQALQDKMAELGIGRVASLSGRYWAMDRDQRWERNARAYATLVEGEGVVATDPLTAIRESYDAKTMDEFVEPTVIQEDGKPVATLSHGDSLIFFNFRADRARQISRSIFDADFTEFERKSVPQLADFVTMTRYEAAFPLPVAFPPVSIDHTLGQEVSGAGLKQLRIAETEKYAHVTYFMNCGREEPFPGEDREMIPSPREVATYDEKPEMSARKVTDELVSKLGEYDFIACNLANLDMVGHTGIIKAAVEACEVVDSCVDRIVQAVLERNGTILLTADHGNAEEMIDATGGPMTAHSKNPVPLVLISNNNQGKSLKQGGKLGDIAPTILSLLDLNQPEQMTGNSLLQE